MSCIVVFYPSTTGPEQHFQYTEFTSYAALLSGAPPHFLQNILVAQHKQTWKLREYHLLSPSDTCLLLGVNSDPEPVTPGSALQAYFPLGTHIEETAQGLVITEPGAGKTPLLYERTTGLQGKPLPTNKDTEDETGLNSRKRHVLDVIITGEVGCSLHLHHDLLTSIIQRVIPLGVNSG